MYNVGMRFVLDAGNVDFYVDEIGTMKLGYVRDNELQVNQTVYPDLVVKGELWKRLNIEFVEEYDTTRAKIEQLISEKDTMICYYAYGLHGTDKSLTVIHLPKKRERVWRYGYKKGKFVQIIDFLESS